MTMNSLTRGTRWTNVCVNVVIDVLPYKAGDGDLTVTARVTEHDTANNGIASYCAE